MKSGKFELTLSPRELVITRTALVVAMSHIINTGADEIANTQRKIVERIDGLLVDKYGKRMVDELKANDAKYDMVNYSQPFGGQGEK